MTSTRRGVDSEGAITFSFILMMEKGKGQDGLEEGRSEGEAENAEKSVM